MDATIGRKIAATRMRAGVTLDKLAAEAHVAASDLVALEDGRSVDLSTAAVARLARVLDVDVADWAGDAMRPSQPSLFFRQTGVPDFFHDDRFVVVDALRQAKAVAAIDALLRRKYARSMFESVAVGPIAFEQGYALAQHVRQVLGIPVEPLGSVRKLVEDEFGVPVLAGEFHALNLLAVTAKERETNLAAVIVNGKRSSHRVDLAHELAHVLFDAPDKDIDYWIDLENDHEAETSKTEQRARAFAAELLIPRKGLIETFGPPHQHQKERSSLVASRDLARRVGEHFQTPPELTTNHLVNQLYIASELREAVGKDLTIASKRSSRNHLTMLERRVAEALQSGLMTRMRAHELLGISARDDLPADVTRVAP